MKDPQLERILEDPVLSAQILARLDKPPGEDEGLEGIGRAGNPSDRLRRVLAEQPDLEKIVRATGRPVLSIRNGTFEVPQVGRWRGPLEAARPQLERAIVSVGRVELANHPDLDWGGTAWIIGENMAVTNRHVAELFTQREGERLVFRSGQSGPIRASLDFRREHGLKATLAVVVEEILFLAPDKSDAPDVALLRLAAGAQHLPIALADFEPEPGRKVAAIGYPAWDPYEDDPLQSKIYGDVYDVKRLAPGEVFGDADDVVFSHDCSTLNGNSGSVIVDLDTGRAVGLHFSGKSKKANYAVRAAVLRGLLQETRQRVSAAVPDLDAAAEAAKRNPRVHPASYFKGRKGYEPAFLGAAHPVPPPRLAGALAEDFARADGSSDGLLHYTHFSVAMSRSRRTALFTAVNIDGRQLRRIVRKDDVWYHDGRLDLAFQIGEDVYLKNRLDRGHLVRRLDPVWGEEAGQADEDTFHFTNAAPQHEDLNQKTWLSLEDYVLANAEAHDLKVSVFSGPVLNANDRVYRNAKLPERYWKVVTMVQQPQKELVATAYVLSQRSLLTDLEFVYGAFRTYQVPVAAVEKMTGLDFGRLRDHDPLAGTEAISPARLIESPADLMLTARQKAATANIPGWTALWDAVEAAITTGDSGREKAAVDVIEQRLKSGETMPNDVTLRGLELLKGHRRFTILVMLAQSLRVFDAEWPALRKVALQGLIELGELDLAIQELDKTRLYIRDMIAAADTGTLVDAACRLQLRPELAEVEGLLGRAHKQRCIVTTAAAGPPEARREDAAKSLGYYWDAYRAARIENLWHGINYVAVSLYASRNLSLSPPGEAPAAVARELVGALGYLESRGALTVWDYATRGEAALALQDVPMALKDYEHYLAHPAISPFKSASTLRQLEQIWELPASHPVMQLFENAKRGNKPNRPNVDELQLQARLRDSPFDDPVDDPNALSRARIVARLGLSERVGDGTGFLFDGSIISDRLAGKPLLLTCAHVCPSRSAASELSAIFFGPSRPGRDMIVGYMELLWTSEELDASLLLLEGGPHTVLPPPVAADAVTVGQRAYIIGHPLGGAKRASLRENKVGEVGDLAFFYLSATEAGSSGSPVFNDKWELTGIHRAGLEAKKSNMGHRIDRIIAALREHPWPAQPRSG